MTETPSLGEKMRAARARLGLRPTDAAKQIGVSRAAYSRWESSREDFPRARNLQAIHEVLGIPLKELVAAGRDAPAAHVLARSGTTGPPPSAPAMHSLLDCSILTAPERGMKDATFREAWKIVGQVWQRANPHRKKASPEDIEKWKALVITLRGFSPVGQTPEPAAEEPWPASGHPLHR